MLLSEGDLETGCEGGVFAVFSTPHKEPHRDKTQAPLNVV